MATFIHESAKINDEFILTLSDHESYQPSDESCSISKFSKKRKSEASSQSNRSKKSKKTKRLCDQSEETQAFDDEDSREISDQDNDDIDSGFEFDLLSENEGRNGALEEFQGWALDTSVKNSSIQGKGSHNLKRAVDLDEIIARRKGERNDEIETEGVETNETDHHIYDKQNLDAENNIDEFMAEDGFGMGVGSDEEESTSEKELDSGDEASVRTSEESSVASPVAHPDDIGTEDEEDLSYTSEDPAEQARNDAFFAPDEKLSSGTKAKAVQTFQDMSLSRPILRGLASVGFTFPTPIQAKTIPVALLGKDVVGGAVTGSGKTAAFIVPILERLLYRPKKIPTCRVVILMPTRELAIQCHTVAKKLASHTDIKFCLVVGGLSLKAQEMELRLRPDVIIGTPGRFIDHMRNSLSFTVDTLEILVLDEADRMLEAGFADELNEIVTTIPKSRQTMLFSATMTSSIDHLIRVGLQRPVRLLVDSKRQTVATLTQEFIRLRPEREKKRMGYLLYLCKNIYTHRAIIFFKQKKEAHRARVIFGLSGLKAAELHGSLSQEQRILSVEAFRDGKVAFLLATDLASRGLDIKGIDTVINYEAPQSHEIYLHRVGRTARAGRHGRACTLAAETDRKVVRAAVKCARSQGAKVTSRIIEASAADQCFDQVIGWENEIDEILKEEKEEKQLAQLEMQVRKGENIIAHKEEIQGRPKRTWFESEREKRVAQLAGRLELNGEGEKKKATHGKLSNKKKKRLADKDSRMDAKVWKKGRAEREGKFSVNKKKEGEKKSKIRKMNTASTKMKFSARRVSQRRKVRE